MIDEAQTRRRLAVLVALQGALALAFLLLVGRELGSHERMASADFSAYATAARLAARGGAGLYDPAAQAAAQAELIAPHRFPGGLLAFLNPPHVALALSPFARLDYATAFRLWTLLQLVVVAFAARSAAAVAAARGPLERWAVLTGVCAFWPLFYAVQIGQLTPLLLLALLRLYLALDEGRDAQAGAWLFVASAKPQLLALLPLLILLSRRPRVVGWAALFGAAGVAVTALTLGWSVWPRYVSSVGALEPFFAQGTPEHMVSLRGLLSLLFGATRPVLVVTWAALGAVVLAASISWWRRPATPQEPGAFARRYATAVALSLLFSPHLFIQDVALWIAPLALSWRALGDEPARRARLGRLLLAWPLAYLAAAFTSAAGRPATLAALILPAATLAWLLREERRPRVSGSS
jgi:arabinofuranan 3-O-arabinosyltransferase